jgi:hypothetical protein
MPERQLRVDLWTSLGGFATGDAPAYFATSAQSTSN